MRKVNKDLVSVEQRFYDEFTVIDAYLSQEPILAGYEDSNRNMLD